MENYSVVDYLLASKKMCDAIVNSNCGKINECVGCPFCEMNGCPMCEVVNLLDTMNVADIVELVMNWKEPPVYNIKLTPNQLIIFKGWLAEGYKYLTFNPASGYVNTWTNKPVFDKSKCLWHFEDSDELSVTNNCYTSLSNNFDCFCGKDFTVVYDIEIIIKQNEVDGIVEY